MNLRGQLSQFLLGLAFIAGWLFVFGSPTIPFAPARIETLTPANIGSNGGSSYLAQLGGAHSAWPFAQIGVDSAVTPRGSNLEILENGVKLGPPHTMHSDIAKIGGGRYSHWSHKQDLVIFSSSDNTDPRTNGRIYSVVVKPQISSLLFVLVAVPFSALLLQWFWSRWLGGAVFAMAAVALVAWLWLMIGHLSLSPDSTTYTTWAPTVPLGYPLFISGIKALLGSLVWVSAVQISLLVAACVFLALSIGKLTGHRAAACAAMLLLICYVPMFSSAGFLLSEGLFVPLLLTNVGAALYLIAEPRKRYALLLAATAALIMFVRPAGYFAPAGILFLALAYRPRFRFMLTWAIAPLIAFVLVTFLVNVTVRGNTSPSQVGRVLFPHVAFMFDPDLITGPDKPFAILIDKVLAPRREAYRKATNLEERVRYSMNDYNSRLSATDEAVRARFATERSRDQDHVTEFQRLDSLYVRLFLRTIYQKPIEYLLLIRDQTLGAWKINIWSDHGSFAQNYVSEMNGRYEAGVNYIKMLNLSFPEAALLPNTAALENFPGFFIKFLQVLYERLIPQKWLIYTIGILTLLAMPVALFAARGSRRWLALGYCGAIIHGSILLTSTVTVFINRYAIPVDPVILVAGVIMLDGMLSWGIATVTQLQERSAWTRVLQRIGWRSL